MVFRSVCAHKHSHDECPAKYGIDLGERKTIKELAEIFDKVYGFKPKLERLGSLDDLKAKMLDMQATNPIEVSSYMPL